MNTRLESNRSGTDQRSGTLPYLNTEPSRPLSTGTLISQIVESFQKLITQEIALGKAEIRAEYARARTSFLLLLLYLACGLFASVLLTLALIHVLSALELADWAVYSIAGGLYAAGTGVFYYMYRNNSKSTKEGDSYGH